MLSQSVVKLPHENVVPTQRDFWKKKPRGAMAMAQCVAASFVLNALPGLSLSCCLLSSRQASSSHNQSSLVLVSDCETSAATL